MTAIVQASTDSLQEQYGWNMVEYDVQDVVVESAGFQRIDLTSTYLCVNIGITPSEADKIALDRAVITATTL